LRARLRLALILRRVVLKRAIGRAAFSVTRIEEVDITMAAISGVT
jgi:hypothetical protein